MYKSKVERHLSRLIVEDKCGHILHHNMSIVSIQRFDDRIVDYKISQYEKESEAVFYHDRTLRITTTDDGLITFNEIL